MTQPSGLREDTPGLRSVNVVRLSTGRRCAVATGLSALFRFVVAAHHQADCEVAGWGRKLCPPRPVDVSVLNASVG